MEEQVGEVPQPHLPLLQVALPSGQASPRPHVHSPVATSHASPRLPQSLALQQLEDGTHLPWHCLVPIGQTQAFSGPHSLPASAQSAPLQQRSASMQANPHGRWPGGQAQAPPSQVWPAMAAHSALPQQPPSLFVQPPLHALLPGSSG